VRRLSLAIGDAAAWLFLAAIAVTLWEVAARYLLNAPTSWAHALATLLCGVAFALGGAHALARDEHVRIGVLYDRFRPRARRAADLLGFALGLFYLAGLGLGFWDQAKEAVWRFDWHGNWDPERTPGPPNWPLPAGLRAALVAGTVLFLLLLLRLAWARVRTRDAASPR
jgi:TRAP-type mannitol/chloroaromatic compound transport system permease small subunit